MPVLASLGPSRRPPFMPTASAGLSAAARKYGVKPMPALEWNAQVERETAHLYARVKDVVPSVEWPFFAPTVKAINDLKKERGDKFKVIVNADKTMRYASLQLVLQACAEAGVTGVNFATKSEKKVVAG